jgi:hypothetical protein
VAKFTKTLTIRCAIAAVAWGFAMPADAAFICPAYPKEYLAVGGDGLVYTAVNNGSSNVITAICSVTANDDGVSPQACTAWYSLLLTLRNTGGHALPHFNESASSNASIKGCSGLNSWEHHVPYFLLAQ